MTLAVGTCSAGQSSEVQRSAGERGGGGEHERNCTRLLNDKVPSRVAGSTCLVPRHGPCLAALSCARPVQWFRVTRARRRQHRRTPGMPRPYSGGAQAHSPARTQAYARAAASLRLQFPGALQRPGCTHLQFERHEAEVEELKGDPHLPVGHRGREELLHAPAMDIR